MAFRPTNLNLEHMRAYRDAEFGVRDVAALMQCHAETVKRRFVKFELEENDPEYETKDRRCGKIVFYLNKNILF